MSVDVRLRLCGACVFLMAVIGFIACRQWVAGSPMPAIHEYEVWVSCAAMLAVGLGLSQRPSLPGAVMFVLAGTAAAHLLWSAASPGTVRSDYIFVNYFGATMVMGFFGLSAALFAPREDPGELSTADQHRRR